MVVGLTGGIASGKSTVARRFAALGADVIDTDDIARDVVAPGTPGLQWIVDTFGREMLDASGRLDRRRLREHVFRDPAARERLERALHPLIESEATALIRRSEAPYVILVVPLLVEKGWTRLVDRVLVVDASPADQRQRLAARDGTDDASADAIIRAQATREQRLSHADDVLVNDGPVNELVASVDALHRRYLA
ncbi:MAG TPA: dephospho-CoA kinase, partial [Gammaproteobacteria bacterium]|nr:dephospho-CoA kinase [Gammaproteobacteria bacterium]